MILVEFFIALIFSFIMDLFNALVVWWIFSIINIAFLANLSYWQVFGLCIVVSLMTSQLNTSSD